MIKVIPNPMKSISKDERNVLGNKNISEGSKSEPLRGKEVKKGMINDQ